MRIEILSIHDLGADELLRWRALQSLSPSLQSPFFTPEYAQLIASVRPDVRLAVIEAGTGIQGFLAVQNRFGSVGMPLGAPLNDYQGVIGAPELRVEPRDLCGPLGVARFDFTHVPTEQHAFAPYARSCSSAWIADISPGAAAYFAGIKARHRNFLYQLGRVHRKLERERGSVAFAAGSQQIDHLETLLQWKAQQLRETGQPQVWRRPWVREAIVRSLAQTGPHFGGVLFTLSIGDRLIAANFCLRSESVLHGMVMAHDRAFEPYSPGLQLMRYLLEWATAQGIREVDFGAGDQLYKRQFGTHRRTTMGGWVGRPSFASLVRATQYAVRTQVEKLPYPWLASLPGRAMRRLDVYRGLAAPVMRQEGWS